MTVGALAAVGLLTLGVAVVAIGFYGRLRSRDRALAEILATPHGEAQVELRQVALEHGAVVAGTLGLAGRAIDRWDDRGSLRERIERADISLRPAELVVIAGCAGLAVGAVLAVLLGVVWIVPVVLALTPFAVHVWISAVTRRRAARFSAQLPDALGLLAGSLESGNTFLRSIQLMSEEFPDPLAGEFRQVVSETELGLPLTTSLERLAGRIDLPDVDWLVQAIAIQQQVGGRMSDLLATLADFMRARDEVRREVRALTAEGRLSAWILGALPIGLLVTVRIVNPEYLDPLLEGWGIVVLALTGVSVVVGMALILRMVRQVEV